jgi:hypothetical protein
VEAIMKNCDHHLDVKRECEVYEVETFAKLDSAVLERLTLRKRTAGQDQERKAIKAPKNEAQPALKNEAQPSNPLLGAQPKPAAKPKALSKAGLHKIKRASENLLLAIGEYDAEMADFNPTANQDDKDVPARHLESGANWREKANDWHSKCCEVITNVQIVGYTQNELAESCSGRSPRKSTRLDRIDPPKSGGPAPHLEAQLSEGAQSLTQALQKAGTDTSDRLDRSIETTSLQ